MSEIEECHGRKGYGIRFGKRSPRPRGETALNLPPAIATRCILQFVRFHCRRPSHFSTNSRYDTITHAHTHTPVHGQHTFFFFRTEALGAHNKILYRTRQNLFAEARRFTGTHYSCRSFRLFVLAFFLSFFRSFPFSFPLSFLLFLSLFFFFSLINSHIATQTTHERKSGSTRQNIVE